MDPHQLSDTTCAKMAQQQQKLTCLPAASGPGSGGMPLAEAGGQCTCKIFKTALGLQTWN